MATPYNPAKPGKHQHFVIGPSTSSQNYEVALNTNRNTYESSLLKPIRDRRESLMARLEMEAIESMFV
jgi:hypothetical protein